VRVPKTSRPPWLGSFAGTRNIAFHGDGQAPHRAVEDQRAIAAARGSGRYDPVVLAAQAIFHLSHGEYADAYETATAMRRDDTISMSAEALPAIVEAGLRSGHATEAAAALADLERCAAASGTGWALGLLARSAALMAPPDHAAELYQEAIDILGRTTATADLARAPLLFGEWLRRHQRPASAASSVEPHRSSSPPTPASCRGGCVCARRAAEIATIGDAANGGLMFVRAGLGIAMGNAGPEVRRAARRAVTSNQDEGFAGAVERFVLP
jgi:haloacid dehalogenase-like hydrolase